MASSPRSSHLIRSHIVPLAFRLLTPKHPELLPVFERFGVRTESGPFELAVPRVQELLEELSLATRDPLLGHHLAQGRPEGSHGIVEYFWRSAANVEEATREVARVSALLNDTAEWMWKRRAGAGLLVHRVPAMLAGLGRHANEFVVTTILSEIEKLTGRPVRALRVTYEHKRGAPGVDYQALHNAARVEFDSGMTGVELDDETLARPVISASPTLLDTLRRTAIKGIAAVAGEAPTSTEATALLSRISELVRLKLRDGVPTLKTLAASMQTSPRSLQRSLQADGTSLRGLIDQVRREEAERRLVQERVEISTLGRELGFSDPSAFGRAFRRWSGKSPTEYRATRRG